MVPGFAPVFGVFLFDKVRVGKGLAKTVSAARRDGAAQMLVRFLTSRGSIAEHGYEEEVNGLLHRMVLPGEDLLLTVNDPPEPKNPSNRVVVFTITSSASKEIGPLLSYVARLTKKLKDATREEAHRVVDRIAVLMSLIKHHGNRTFVAKELRMGRALVAQTIEDILMESGMDPSLLPTRRKHIYRKKS